MDIFSTPSGPYDNTGVSQPNEKKTSQSIEQTRNDKFELEDYNSTKSEKHLGTLKNKFMALRIVTFFFNLSFLFLSFVVMGIGIYLLLSENDISFSFSNFLSGSILVIIVGIIILFISSLGVISSIFPIQCFLMIYIIFMLIVLIIEISIGVWGFVVQDDVKLSIRSEFQFGIQTEYGNNNILYVNSINFIQDVFDCCGYYGFGDWNISTFANLTFNQTNLLYYPQQCCDSEHIYFNSMMFCNSSVLISFNIPGCKNKVDKFAVGLVIGVGVIGVVLALLQTLGILLTLFLSCYKKKLY